MENSIQPEDDECDIVFDDTYAAKIPWSAIEWTLKQDPIIEDQFALAVLLAREVIFLNSFWYNKDWPKEAREKTNLLVNCNDVFAWGCSDAEEINHSEIEDLWKHFKQDQSLGPAVWCMKKRGQLAQTPVLKRIIEKNIWDMDKLKADLKVNYYDTSRQMLREAEYKAYSEWCVESDKVAIDFKEDWYSEFKNYAKAHPDYYNLQWYKDAHKKIMAFRETYNSAKSNSIKESPSHGKRILDSISSLFKKNI